MFKQSIALLATLSIGSFAYTVFPAHGEVLAVSQPVLLVAPNRSEGNGTFATITAALARAQAGVTIQIAPGNYTRETGEIFPLRVPNGVKIQGSNGVIISGGGSFFSSTFAGQNVAMVAGDNTQISGITLTNSNPRGYGLWLESAQNVTVSNNTFRNSTHDGVFLTGNTKAVITNNLFTQNKASGIAAVGISSGEIRDNTFDNTGFGLSIGQRSSVVVSNNRIINNVDGVVMTNTAIPTLRGNLIANNQRNGLVILRDRNGQPSPNLGTVESPGDNTFSGNRVRDINNATGVNMIAVGNRVDPKNVAGLVELVAVARPSAEDLADIRGHWAESYIAALAQRGIIGGFADGTFRPNDPVTRAQFAAILSRAFANRSVVRPSNTFVDVPQNFWAFRAINDVQMRGFMSGFKNNVFRPSENIPRVQVLVALVNGWQIQGGNPSGLAQAFSDADQIPDYAVGAIAAARANRLVLNYPDLKMLEPRRNATRAEVAAFVYQTLVSRGLSPVIQSQYIVNP